MYEMEEKNKSKDQFIGKIGLALQDQTFVMAYTIKLGACVNNYLSDSCI